jgi:hypothetical protein
MSKLRDILLERKAEISRKVVPLATEIARIKEQLSKMQSELEVWKFELEQIHFALKAVDETEAKNSQITIMDAVMAVLEDHPEGMTALEILAEINTRYFGGRIARSSLSPQLSRLKDRDKKIDLRGKRWFARSTEPTLFAPKS